MLSLESDREQIPFYHDDVTTPSTPGPSGTTMKKISASEPNVDNTMRIPELTGADFWITKDQNYERVYNDEAEWDYIPEDSPLKGKEKARRIETHFGLPPLPPNHFQQYDAPPPGFCRLPSVPEYVRAQSDTFGNKERRCVDPKDLMKCENG
jgi:hypothetical protein